MRAVVEALTAECAALRAQSLSNDVVVTKMIIDYCTSM